MKGLISFIHLCYQTAPQQGTQPPPAAGEHSCSFTVTSVEVQSCMKTHYCLKGEVIYLSPSTVIYVTVTQGGRSSDMLFNPHVVWTHSLFHSNRCFTSAAVVITLTRLMQLHIQAEDLKGKLLHQLEIWIFFCLVVDSSGLISASKLWNKCVQTTT